MADSEFKLPAVTSSAGATSPDSSKDPSEPLKYEPSNKLLSVVIGVAFAVFLIGGMHLLAGYLPHFIAYILAAVVMGSGLVRLVKASFIDVQSRTVEWLAAIFFSGVLMGLGKEFLAQFRTVDHESNTYLMVSLAAVSIVWSFGGAAWGWRLAKRMNESDGRKRLWYIAAAWLSVIGIGGAITLLVGLILAATQGDPVHYLLVIAIGLVLMTFVVPAWRLDKRAPLLASQHGNAFKPVLIDKYEKCRFGPQTVNVGTLIINLTGFNLFFLPLIVFKMIKKKATPETTELQLSQMPAPIAEFIDEHHEPFRELGFKRKYYYRSSAKGRNIVAFGAMYAHPQLGQHCSITAAYVLTHAGAIVYRCAFDIFSRFDDDSAVLTNNSSDLNLIQLENANAKLKVMRFPEVEDPILLHRLHCARIRKLGKPEIGILHASAESPAGLQEELQKRVNEEHALTWTLPGIYWGTWSVVWPASLVRLHRLRKRARAEMAALGFDPDSR